MYPFPETPYDKHWNAKGEYGQERVRRKNERKSERYKRRMQEREYRQTAGRCEFDRNKMCNGCMDC